MLRFTRETLKTSYLVLGRGEQPSLRTRLYLRNSNQLIGQSLSSINHYTGVINHLLINEQFREKGYGSLLLTETERWMQNWFPLDKFQLVSHSNTLKCGNNLKNFYLKNGWYEIDKVTDGPFVNFDFTSPTLCLMEKRACLPF